MKQLWTISLMILVFPFYVLGFAFGAMRSAFKGGIADAVFEIEQK